MPLVPRDTALQRGMRRFSRRGLIKVSAGGAAGAALAVGPVQRAEQALIQATPAPAPQTHEFTLTASEFDWELMADVTVRAWGYNGQMPGPEMRVRRATRSGSPWSTSSRCRPRSTGTGSMSPPRWTGWPGSTRRRSSPGEPSPTSSPPPRPAPAGTTPTPIPRCRCRSGLYGAADRRAAPARGDL